MPKASYNPSIPAAVDNVAPAFELADLELIGEADIPGVTWRLLLNAEHAEEEAVAMVEVWDWRLHGTRRDQFCSFHRCSNAVRIEFLGTQFYVLSVADALDAIRLRAPKQPRIAPRKKPP